MSGAAETIGEIDNVVTVREIEDRDVLDRRCGRQRLAWREELELGTVVWQTEDRAVEPIVVLEGPQDAEPKEPLLEVARHLSRSAVGRAARALATGMHTNVRLANVTGLPCSRRGRRVGPDRTRRSQILR